MSSAQLSTQHPCNNGSCMHHAIHSTTLCHRRAWVMLHICMGRITRMHESYHVCMCRVIHVHESCHTYAWVILYMFMSHVTRVHESCHTYAWVISHMHESCHTYAWIMSYICFSHVIHMHESCHIYSESCDTWVISYMHALNDTWMSHDISKWVMSHICMTHVTRVHESCRICINHLICKWVQSRVFDIWGHCARRSLNK